MEPESERYEIVLDPKVSGRLAIRDRKKDEIVTCGIARHGSKTAWQVAREIRDGLNQANRF